MTREHASYDPDERRAAVRRTVWILVAAIVVIMAVFLSQFLF